MSNVPSNKVADDNDKASLRAKIHDLLLLGDKIALDKLYNTNKLTDSHTNDLNKRVNLLQEKLNEKKAMIDKLNRDFSDVRDKMGETIPNSKINVVEDYTVMCAMISYAFMIIASIYYSVAFSENKMYALIKAIIIAIFVTIIALMLLYYIA